MDYNSIISTEKAKIKQEYDKLKSEVVGYLLQYGSCIDPLTDNRSVGTIPKREDYTDGFLYAYETINDYEKNDSFCFPRVLNFENVSATAINENTEYSYLLFNFALMAIYSYAVGDCEVYMFDDNVGGDFNKLSEITTDISEEMDGKQFFHYVTDHKKMTGVIEELSLTMKERVIKYKNVPEYNRKHPEVFIPYIFLFVHDVNKSLPDPASLKRMSDLVNYGNACKAGIFVFYSYEHVSNRDVYSEPLQDLLNNSFNLKPEFLDNSSSVFDFCSNAIKDDKVLDKVLEYVKKGEKTMTVLSREDEIRMMLASEKLWSVGIEETKKGLQIPVGFVDASRMEILNVTFAGNAPHIVIAGKSGFGKTMLLYNIIFSCALKYSPRQLRLFMVGLKGGGDFARFRCLPHVAALSNANSTFYALSLLDFLIKEWSERRLKFEEEDASSLDVYNMKAVEKGKSELPYFICIIDEYQKLFNEGGALLNGASGKLNTILTEGRSYGIVLILCSQKAPSEKISDDQFGNRISLYLENESDSRMILGNGGARKLKQFKALIRKNRGEDESGNEEFLVGYINEKHQLDYVSRIKEIWLKINGGEDELDHLSYSDGDNNFSIAENEKFLIGCDGKKNIYLGKPAFFQKEHIKFFFHRDANSNVVLNGQDRETSLRLVGLIASQFMNCYGEEGGSVYLVDMQPSYETTCGALNFLDKVECVEVSNSGGIRGVIDTVYEKLEQRKGGGEISVKEVLLAIVDFRFGEIEEELMFYGNNQQLSTAQKLIELIRDGSQYGIHILLYFYNGYGNFMKKVERYQVRDENMEIKIGLRGFESGFYVRSWNMSINKWGHAVVRMPEHMGMYFSEADPFVVYNSVGENVGEYLGWRPLMEQLFSDLPNRKK